MSVYDDIIKKADDAKTKTEQNEILINQTISIFKEFGLYVLTKLRDSIDPKLEIVKLDNSYEVVSDDKKIRFEVNDNREILLLRMELYIQHDEGNNEILTIVSSRDISNLYYLYIRTSRYKTYSIYLKNGSAFIRSHTIKKYQHGLPFSIEELIKIFEQS